MECLAKRSDRGRGTPNFDLRMSTILVETGAAEVLNRSFHLPIDHGVVMKVVVFLGAACLMYVVRSEVTRSSHPNTKDVELSEAF